MSFYTALTGLNGSQADISATSNNIANVATTGYKRSKAEFGDIFATSPLQNASSSIGSGTILKGIKQQFTQGNVSSSLNALDMAIDGAGFFQVLLPDGRIGFTRNGAFTRNQDGVLTTPSGYVLQPEIAIPESVTQINVSSDGIVSVQVAGQVAAEEVGQITLADFANRAGLQPIGENFVVETNASGAAAVGNPRDGGFGKLVQGSLEGSNVNVVQELVDMIETQRAYEVSSKSISASDEMMRFIAQNL